MDNCVSLCPSCDYFVQIFPDDECLQNGMQMVQRQECYWLHKGIAAPQIVLLSPLEELEEEKTR